MSADHSLTLTEGLHAPSRARAWVSAQLFRFPRSVLEDALLLVSELVTNAVRHGAPDIVVSVQEYGDRVRLEVGDGSSRLPVVPTGRPATDRPTGRGLLIVAATAADWGVERRPGQPGKVVWAELHVPAEPS